MSLVTIVWSVLAAGALLLAILYGLVWVMDRQARASLAFSFEALSMVAIVVVELGMMFSTTPEEWGEWVRWAQVPFLMRTVAFVAFVRLYFDAGRSWLLWAAIVSRSIVLVAGFLTDPNFNFTRIDSVDRIPFLGERVTVLGQAVVSPYQWFATVATYLPLLFVADASVTLWRRGTPEGRRKAAVIGGSALLAWALGGLVSQLMIYGIVHLPPLLAPPDLVVLGAMTFELSRDALRASRLARELRESEARLQLAASAAGLGLCFWDVASGKLWATQGARELLGLGEHEPVDVERLGRRIHPDDVEALRAALREARASGAGHEVRFRISRPDGRVTWIAARGSAELDSRGRVTLLRGVLRDVTAESRTQQKIEELQRDLAHAARVSMLGTLSSSLTHELSQPLSAIELNTGVAQLVLDQPSPDLEELRQIVEEVHRDNRRAVAVIDHLRTLLKRREVAFAPVPVEGLLAETSALLKSDLIVRDVRLEVSSDPDIPRILGDYVQLSQVLINLVMNAMDAVASMPAERRVVSVRAHPAERGWVELAVEDSGVGISPPALDRIFEPFYTTKDAGMGVGLAVSRTIVEAHGGRIWAEAGAGGGALFRVRLPATG